MRFTVEAVLPDIQNAQGDMNFVSNTFIFTMWLAKKEVTFHVRKCLMQYVHMILGIASVKIDA